MQPCEQGLIVEQRGDLAQTEQGTEEQTVQKVGVLMRDSVDIRTQSFIVTCIRNQRKLGINQWQGVWSVQVLCICQLQNLGPGCYCKRALTWNQLYLFFPLSRLTEQDFQQSPISSLGRKGRFSSTNSQRRHHQEQFRVHRPKIPAPFRGPKGRDGSSVLPCYSPTIS